MEAKITSAGSLFQICGAVQLKALLANAIPTPLVTARRDDELTIIGHEHVPVSSALQVDNATAYFILHQIEIHSNLPSSDVMLSDLRAPLTTRANAV